jgi:hypothetical protein
MKIFLQDSCFAHCEYSNNPMPPIQFSDDIIWDRSNEYTDNDIVIYTDNSMYSSRNNNQKDIAWLIEPKELQENNYNYIVNNYSKFYKIFTHDYELLNLPNAILIPYGGCWIKKDDFFIYDKIKNTSIICSNKNFLSGHRLRHECINKFKDKIDIYGNGYNAIESKLEALKDYRFQIVIENSKKDFWFTEKLIDCFVTGTIPIYYGCDSIGDFFDKNGIISFASLEELNNILENLTTELYKSKLDSIKNNFKISKKYILSENTIFEKINNNL